VPSTAGNFNKMLLHEMEKLYSLTRAKKLKTWLELVLALGKSIQVCTVSAVN
jgi:hypothetical protein